MQWFSSLRMDFCNSCDFDQNRISACAPSGSKYNENKKTTKISGNLPNLKRKFQKLISEYFKR